MIRFDALKIGVHLRLLACAALALSGLASSFNAWAADTVADPLTFSAVSNAEPGSVVISNSQTVSGIDTNVPIKVSGGLYSINGGTFTNANGTVSNGATVRVQQTASATVGTTTTAKLSLGTPLSAYSFRVTTRNVDTVPDAFSFGTVTEAGLGSIQTSTPSTITGIDAPAPITVTGGSYSIDGGEFTTAAGSVSNNAQVRARGTAGSSVKQSTTVTVKIGGVSGTFKITTIKVLDTTPNAFSFAPTLDAPLGSTQTSAPATITGINSPASIAIVGGLYSINDGPFTAGSGTISSGSTVKLQQTASSNPATTTTSTLSIGGVNADYAVTTVAADTTPDAFSFPPRLDAPLGSTNTSSSVAIVGINSPAPISVVGGSYSINGGPFTATSGTITNAATVRVRQTASSSPATTTISTLSIGSVSANYAVTTVAVDTTPDPFSFPPTVDAPTGSTQTSAPAVITGINGPASISIVGGSYSIDGGAFSSVSGTISSGSSVRVQQLASNSTSTTTTAILSIGGVGAGYSVTTSATDTTPDPFSFAAAVDVAKNSVQTSAAATINGISGPTPVSIVGGTYSVNGATFTTANGTITNGQQVRVRQTASDLGGTTTVATLSVGSVSAGYSVTTQVTDTTPDAFSFPPVVDAALASTQTSAQVTITGINSAAPISIVGGTYAINSGVFTSEPGSVTSGQRVRVRQTASSSPSTTTTATVTIGGVSADYSVTTLGVDTTPNPFSFPPTTNAALGSTQTSAAVQILGIAGPSPISIVGGLYAIDTGLFTSAPGNISNGQRVRIQQAASTNFGTTTTAAVTIGGVSADYAVTTLAQDTTPNPFSFAPVTNAAPGSVNTSASVTINGINSPAPISIVGGLYRIGEGPWTDVAGTVANASLVQVQQTASSSLATTTTATLTVGGVSAGYSVTTLGSDTTPDPFTFAPTTGAALGTTQNSAPVSISGIDSPTAISVVGGFYSVNNGPFVDSPGQINPGASIRVQVLASLVFNETRTATLTIGGVSGDYSVTSQSFDADTTPDAFAFPARSDVPVNSVQTSAAITVSGINAQAVISVTGGRYQINGGAFRSVNGTVIQGDLVVAEVTAAATPATARSATVTIGGISSDFTVTTVSDVDRTPESFSLLPIFDVPPGSVQTSLPIALRGLDAAADISISGGRYSINGGAFTSALGSVIDGDSIVIELLASSDNATTTVATVTIGGVSADYRVRTRVADNTPDPFAFAPITNAVPGSLVTSAAIAVTGIDVRVPISISGGRYSINGAAYTAASGTLANGDTVAVEVAAAPSFVTITSARLTVGSVAAPVSADFMVTTSNADLSPNAFSFTNQPNAFPGLATISNTVTVSGIDAAVAVSVTGGWYSINGAPFLGVPGPIRNGDQLRLLVTPGRNNGDVVTAIVTVGSSAASFTVTTNSVADNYPDQFQFRDTRVPINTAAISESTLIRGINVPTQIAVQGGSYSVNNGPFITTPSTVKGGDYVRLGLTAPPNYNSSRRMTLGVGTVISANWTVLTDYDPTKLRPFVLESANGYSPGSALGGSMVITKPVTVVTPGAPVSVSISGSPGARYSVNGGRYTAASGTVANGDRVIVQFPVSTVYSPDEDHPTVNAATLNIGGTRSTFSISTVLDPVATTPATHDGCEAHVFREMTPVPLRLFVCYPAGWSSSDRRSAMVLWYGGAFITGTTVRSIDEVKFWADTHGMVGIAPDYRVNDRFGSFTYDSANDARAALKWVEDNAATLGIDPLRVVVNGTSSGGTQGFFAALRDAPATGDTSDNPPLRPAAIVSRSGAPDTTLESQVHDDATAGRFGGYATAISPSLHTDVAFPPTLIIYGDEDDKSGPTPSVDFCTGIIKLGRICQFNSKHGVGHGLSSPNNTPIVQEDTRVFLLSLGLLPAVPPPPPPP